MGFPLNPLLSFAEPREIEVLVETGSISEIDVGWICDGYDI